jgi:hypothetical protein
VKILVETGLEDELGTIVWFIDRERLMTDKDEIRKYAVVL